MSSKIDFSKIPHDRPAAVHFESLLDAITFLNELSKYYPNKASHWTEGDLVRRFDIYKDFCLNPYMDSPGETLCYCDLGYYVDEGYVIVEFSDLYMGNVELPIGECNTDIESLLGME